MRTQTSSSRTQYLSVLVLGSCLLVAGCGGGGGSESTTTASSASSSSSSAGSAAVTVDKSSINFGKVVIGQTSVRPFSITNTGGVDLNNVTLSAPAEGFAIAGTCPQILIGDSCDLAVEFSPTEQRDYSASIALGAGGPTATIDLSGQGQGLNVEISSLTESCLDPTVDVRVFVSDAANNPITTLTQNEFQLAMSGDAIDPFTFSGITAGDPVSVALTVDWSTSLGAFRDTLTQTSEVFIDTLAPVDTAAFYRFGDAIDGNAQNFVLTDAAGKDLLKDAIYADFDGDRTISRIWEAAIFAVEQTAAQPNPNRAVFLLTDALDNSNSTIDEQDLIDSALQNNVNVFTLGYGDNVDSDVLQEVAEETGGLYFYAPDAQGLTDIYQSIVTILTNQYELSFTNPIFGSAGQLVISAMDDQGNEGEDAIAIAACP